MLSQLHLKIQHSRSAGRDVNNIIVHNCVLSLKILNWHCQWQQVLHSELTKWVNYSSTQLSEAWLYKADRRKIKHIFPFWWGSLKKQEVKQDIYCITFVSLFIRRRMSNTFPIDLTFGMNQAFVTAHVIFKLEVHLIIPAKGRIMFQVHLLFIGVIMMIFVPH